MNTSTVNYISLDLRTIAFSNVLTSIVCAVVMVALWRQTRKRFPGTGFLAADLAAQTCALLLVVLRGVIPDWASMALGNTLAVAGALLGYVGLQCFVDRRGSQLHNYALLAVFAAVHTYFTAIQPDLSARNLNLSAGLLIVCFQCAWLLMRSTRPELRRATRRVGLVFVAYCGISLIRIARYLLGPHSAGDYFHSGAFEAFILVSYQMLFILLTYTLVLMFNERLLMEVSNEEEKYSKAFRTSPYAITLTTVPDGRIVEVNEGFLQVSGYQAHEVIGHSTVSLGLWVDDEDRNAVLDEMARTGKVRWKEAPFRKKSGEVITGLFSADTISINDKPCVLSSISDITDQKRAMEASATYARQQAAVAELGQVALASGSVDPLLDLAVHRVAEVLGLEFCKVLELLPGGEALLLRAGVGWKEGLVGTATVGAGQDSQAGYTLLSKEPVVVTDLRTEQRFGGPPLLHEHGVVSGLSTIIGELECPYGVLGAHSSRRVTFSQQDVSFVQAIANVLASAIQRRKAEEVLRDREEHYRTTLMSVGDAVIVTDAQGRVAALNPVAETLTGWAQSEAEGLPLDAVFRILNEKTRQVVESPVVRVLREGEVVGLANHTLLVARDGVERPISDSGAPIRNDEGEVTGVVLVFRDQTEHRRVERQMEHLASFPALNPSPILEVAFDRKVTYCNAAGLRLVRELGLEGPEKLLPEDITAVLGAIERGETVLINREVSIGSSTFTAAVYAVSTYGSVRVYLHDITERQRAEDALRESEGNFRYVFESANVGKSITLPTGEVNVNEAFARMLGYTREELRGKTWQELTPPEEVASVSRTIEPLLNGAIDSVRFCKGYLHKSGSRLWADVSTILRRDSAGKPLYFVTTVVDITERQRMEEALAASEARFRAIFENMAAACCVDEVVYADGCAVDYRILDVNPAYERIIGISRARAVGALASDLYGLGEAPFLDVYGRVAETGEPAAFEAYFAPIRKHLYVTVGRPGPGLFSTVFTDISEQKQAEEERERLRVQLAQSQKLEAIGTLASGVAHEINNPINGVMNYAQLILDATEQGSSLHDYAGEIIHESGRVAAIVQNLLQFSRQEKQGHSPARVQDIVNQMLTLIGAVVRCDQITLEVDLPPDLPSIRCRSQQIQQVLLNLLTNARDALNAKYPGHHGDKTIRVRASQFERDGQPWIRVTVEDHGEGIAPEVRERIFDPFFSTKPRDVGTGLGLSISLGLVKDHHGELHFETEPGQWTRFHLDLPAALEEGADA